MRKGLIFLLSVVSFLGINTVSADTIDFNTYDSSDYFTLLNNNTISTLENKFNDVIDDILKEHDHSYYIMQLGISGGNEPYFVVYTYDTSFINYSSLVSYSSENSITSTYYFLQTDNSYRIVIESYSHSFGYGPLAFDLDNFYYYSLNFYLSNMNIYYDSSDVVNIYTDGELLFTLNRGDIIPTYKEIINLSSDYYTTINLNDYSYVILTLKDYSPRDTFASTMYVKGQLCPTTVYNYGLEEKKDYISGYQTQPCSYYYNEFTRFTSNITSEDITNHAIYYLTGYDSSKPNLVKVDTSVYDITYITSENENEPYISIEGKNYPALPYSSLTDTAILTEKNGISDTWTCAKYDTNCYLNSSGIDINNLFSNPLETLKTVWGAIVSIFALITEFIALLPPIMQGFLILAFGVGIAIGIIKVLL